ncbi:equilibrative nucleobase transporter 1-like isoform X2 [Penaeus chinensis]|nr:equilibrative nucleobase transporter 1-like isoform X2 [Penaeus chinensis]XP_047478615.1 equilibrative nucleobase transporter 1-like isoform X2 [Penaeus chinensis]XP_047478616.1 equilibrative nucleobase transporter 1-like isoform X2 [Penaeus chinensis]
MAVLCAQAASIGEMPKWHRWLVFLVGIFETMVWSGTVFGWASLVHVLKTMGVYSHLCKESLHQVYSLSNNATQEVDGAMLLLTDSTQLACSSQDQQFALIYTVACVLYSIPGILLGYCLHHFGLAVTRVLGGLLISSGFILLALTTADSPSYLWGAAIFLSVGGNIIRMAGLQLGNLFPERRNTAIAIISGMFTPSAGMFIILQYAREAGLPWANICAGFAAVASLILLLTPLMPRHHVPYTDEVETQDEVKDEKVILKPVRESIFSWSNLFHTYWVFSNMFCVVLFSTYFNSWINKFSETTDEAAHYSLMYGYANILCFFISPLPGLLVDTIAGKFQKGKTGLQKHIASVQATIIPMILVTLTVTVQLGSLMFQGSAAVYIGLMCLTINRPSCLAVGNPLIRIRFPVEHFNRVIGFQGTAVALLTLLQYPHFTWAQYQPYIALAVTLAALFLNLLHPLHLCSKTYLSRVLSFDQSHSQEKPTKV